jgi:hypothetical protein
MFGQTLYAQWKWNRDFLAFYAFVGFVAPLLILWIGLPKLGLSSARELVFIGGVVGAAVAVISVLAGVTIAWQGYGVDERVGHIYALSLPVTRIRLLAMRAVSAALLLAVPAAGVWVGATITLRQAGLPPTLHGYALALASRALLASWLAHAFMFALRYAAGRRAAFVFAALILTFGSLAFASQAVPSARAPILRAGDFLISTPGPFGVLFGRWTLIDV